MKTYVYIKIYIQMCQRVDITQISINWWMDKQQRDSTVNVVCGENWCLIFNIRKVTVLQGVAEIQSEP